MKHATAGIPAPKKRNRSRERSRARSHSKKTTPTTAGATPAIHARNLARYVAAVEIGSAYLTAKRDPGLTLDNISFMDAIVWLRGTVPANLLRQIATGAGAARLAEVPQKAMAAGA